MENKDFFDETMKKADEILRDNLEFPIISDTDPIIKATPKDLRLLIAKAYLMGRVSILDETIEQVNRENKKG